VRVRTVRAGNVGERAGDERRGLQIESGVGPAQHQLIVQPLKIKRHWWRNTRRILDGDVIVISAIVRGSRREHAAGAVHSNGAGCKAVSPQWNSGARICKRPGGPRHDHVAAAVQSNGSSLIVSVSWPIISIGPKR